MKLTPPFFCFGELEHSVLPNGVTARMVHTDQLSIVHATIEPGVSPPEHAHVNEQVGIVLSGIVDFYINGECERLEAGDGFVIPAGAVHSVVGVERATTFEVFVPPRDDYRHPDSPQNGGQE